MRLILVAVVGEDFPQEHINLLQNMGVNTDGLQIKKGEKSFFWSGRYHNDMNSRDTLGHGTKSCWKTSTQSFPSLTRTVNTLCLGNLSPQVQHTVINRINNRPKLVAMDTMNFWMDIALPELTEDN